MVVSCFYQKNCTSVIPDLVLNSIKKCQKRKKKEKLQKKDERSCERRVERSICLCAQVLKVSSVA
jgi:hypothetical protein